MKVRKIFIICFFVLVVGACVSVLLFLRAGEGFERPGYEVFDLGLARGSFNTIEGYNDMGQIAGVYLRSNFRMGSAIWDEENGLVKLPEEKDTSYKIRGINNKGQAVGTMDNYVGFAGPFATSSTRALPTSSVGFIRDADGVITLLPFGEGMVTSAECINDRGEVAGVIVGGGSDQNRGISYKLFMWDKIRGIRVIDDVEGVHIHISGINEAGQVAGMINSKDGVRTFLWSESEGVLYGYALARQIIGIDDAGRVGGEYLIPGGEVFVWDEKDGMQLSGVKGDNLAFCSMNDKGDIVGTVTDRGIFIWRYSLGRSEDDSFLYTREGKRFALDMLFGDNEQFYPSGINDNRWIVGEVRDKTTGNYRRVLLRPE